jgi:hypothetical protein
MDRKQLPLEPRQLGGPSGASTTISDPMVRLAQTVHLSCSDTNTISKRTKTRFHMRHINWSSIGFVQNDIQAYGTLAQTVHLSCVKISTISKWNETSFHMSLIILDFHRVRAKHFLSPWSIWRKPCTYLALTLILSLMYWNEIPHEPSHLGVPSDVSKTIFQAYGTST